MSRLDELLAEIEARSPGAPGASGDAERVLELCLRALDELDDGADPALRRRLHTLAAEVLLHRFEGDRGENLEAALAHARRALAERRGAGGRATARLISLLGGIYRWRRSGERRANLRHAAAYVEEAVIAGGDRLTAAELAELRLAAAEIRAELDGLGAGRDRGGDLGLAASTDARAELAAAAAARRRALAGAAPVVSTGFADAGSGAGTLRADRPLRPVRRYRFWLEIAPTRLPGAIEQGIPEPLPEGVPAEAELDVVLFAYSDGLEIEPGADRARLRLRPGGRAEVVSAAGAGSPEAAPGAETATRLYFPVRTPAAAGPRRLRCSIFHRGLLLQSREVTAWVGTDPPPGERALEAVVDFTLSTRLDPAALATQPRHALSVLVNDDGAGAHGVRLWSDAGEGEPIKLESSLGEGVLGGLIRQARGALRKASWGSDSEWRPGIPYLYTGSPSRRRLRDDLVAFAIHGYRIYTKVALDLAGGTLRVEELAERMRRPGYVQVVHRESGSADPVLLPAAMCYDRIGFDTGARLGEFRLCPEFVRALDAGADLAGHRCFTGDCPHREETKLTVCPGGFWGFRHRLGLPASAGAGADAALDASDLTFDGAPDLTIGVSTDPGLPRRAGHEERIERIAGGRRHRAASRRDLLDLLENGRPHVVYLYCHGGLAGDLPYLQVGPKTERGITPDNLFTVLWRGPRPVVVINGCHTTALSPEHAYQFVTALVGRSQAAGVVGTEITVFEPLACAFGEELLGRFLAEEPLGEAVRRARLRLLAAGNPLGLVYVPYALPGLSLRRRTA